MNIDAFKLFLIIGNDRPNNVFFQQGEKPYKIVKGRPKRVRTVMICCVNVVVDIA